jgi:hypothetical protein
MAAWNLDMARAPRGKVRLVATGKGKATRKVPELVTIIAASACGVVCLTKWLDAEQRWNMFTREVPPIAWQPYSGPRAYVDAKGKTRYAIDLPDHPTMAESWFTTFMRERGTAVPPAQRQRACLDWIAARVAA